MLPASLLTARRIHFYFNRIHSIMSSMTPNISTVIQQLVSGKTADSTQRLTANQQLLPSGKKKLTEAEMFEVLGVKTKKQSTALSDSSDNQDASDVVVLAQAGATSAEAAAAEDCAALGADGCGTAVGADAASPALGAWALLPLLALGGGGGSGSSSLNLFQPTSPLNLYGGGVYRLPVNTNKNTPVGDFDANKTDVIFRITQVTMNGENVTDADLFLINPSTGEVRLNVNASGLETCLGSSIEIKVVAEKDGVVTASKSLSLVLDVPTNNQTFTVGTSTTDPVGDPSKLDMLTVKLNDDSLDFFFAWEGLGKAKEEIHFEFKWDSGSSENSEIAHISDFDFIRFTSSNDLVLYPQPNSVKYYGYELDQVYKIADAPEMVDGKLTATGSDCADLIIGVYSQSSATNYSTTDIELVGGNGNDVIIGSKDARNTFIGGAGNDLLVGSYTKSDTYIFDLTEDGIDWLATIKAGDTVKIYQGSTLQDTYVYGTVDVDFTITSGSDYASIAYKGDTFAYIPYASDPVLVA
jgi:hypothetical protein